MSYYPAEPFRIKSVEPVSILPKAEREKAMKEAATQVEATTEEVPVTVDDAQAAKAKEEADKEALKILEKKRKGN